MAMFFHVSWRINRNASDYSYTVDVVSLVFLGLNISPSIAPWKFNVFYYRVFTKHRCFIYVDVIIFISYWLAPAGLYGISLHIPYELFSVWLLSYHSIYLILQVSTTEVGLGLS